MKACAKHHVMKLAGYTLALITDFFYFALFFVTTLIPLKVAGFKQTSSKGISKKDIYFSDRCDKAQYL